MQSEEAGFCVPKCADLDGAGIDENATRRSTSGWLQGSEAFSDQAKALIPTGVVEADISFLWVE